jgi:hypothetical protein
MTHFAYALAIALLTVLPAAAQAEPDDGPADDPSPDGQGPDCDFFWYTLPPDQPGVAIRPECIGSG